MVGPLDGLRDEGRVVGFMVGEYVGAIGILLGLEVLGLRVGDDGEYVGFNSDGYEVGFTEGLYEGFNEGLTIGGDVGCMVGTMDGKDVKLGRGEGRVVDGIIDGVSVGDVGLVEGLREGNAVPDCPPRVIFEFSAMNRIKVIICSTLLTKICFTRQK